MIRVIFKNIWRIVYGITYTNTSKPGKQPPDVIFYSFQGNEDLYPVKTLEFHLKISLSLRGQKETVPSFFLVL